MRRGDGHRLGPLHDQDLRAPLPARRHGKELLGARQLLDRMGRRLGEDGKEIGIRDDPGPDERPGFGPRLFRLPVRPAFRGEAGQGHEKLEIGMPELQHHAAGFAGIAGKSIGAPRVAEDRARELEGRSRLPDPGGTVKEVGVSGVACMQGGAEKR